MANSSDIPGGLRIPHQAELDAKKHSLSEAALSNLGPQNNLAYTYFEGLEAYCQLEKTRWEWREVKPGETGLISINFVYPNGWVANGKDYSLKPFNFFKTAVSNKLDKGFYNGSADTLYQQITSIDEDLTTRIDDVSYTIEVIKLPLKADKSDTYNKAEVDQKLTSVYRWQGNKANYAALLATTGMQVGHVYNLLDTGKNYGWTGSVWDDLGGIFDASGKADKVDTYTKNEVNALIPNQNNFSKVIKILPDNLSGIGTLEEQIVAYVNSLNYNKLDTDSDIWIEVETENIVAPPPTPINCVVSDWGEWSTCSMEGFQTRTRTVIVSPSNGGTACPVLSETRACTYIPVNNKVGTITNVTNDVMTFEVHPEVQNRQFSCGGYSGLGLQYRSPGTSNFTEVYFNYFSGSPTTADLFTYEFANGTELQLIDTTGDLEDSDIYTINIVSSERTQLFNKYTAPCGGIAIVWLDLATSIYYTDEFGPNFYNGNLYDYEGQIDQVGQEFQWSYMSIENGEYIPANSGTTISPCAPN